MISEFNPNIWLRNPHIQTLLGSKWRPPKVWQGAQSHIELPDQDRLICATNTPSNWQETDPTVLIFHGLLGHQNAPYVLRAAQIMLAEGWRVIRVNFRGCGPGFDQAKGICHSGRSEDIAAAVAYTHQQYPQSLIGIVGFSQGGNVVLKYASECHNDPVSQIVAICPPIDLAACADRFTLKSNRMIRHYFVKKLRHYTTTRHRLFPELGSSPVIASDHGLWEFDQYYTSQHAGFNDVHEYYNAVSSIRTLEHIETPTTLLFAEDDPIIDCSMVDPHNLPANISIYKTRHGGHMGYFQLPRPTVGWLDHFIATHLNESLKPT